MIIVDHLTKRYGNVVAVDELSFEVGSGRVTGFLGPNGAGKTTTLRMLLGLATADGGTATIDGRRYRDLPDPARRVGAAQLAKWLITGAASPLTDPTAQGPGTLAPLAAVAVLGGYTVLLLAVATQLILRRDVA